MPSKCSWTNADNNRKYRPPEQVMTAEPHQQTEVPVMSRPNQWLIFTGVAVGALVFTFVVGGYIILLTEQPDPSAWTTLAIAIGTEAGVVAATAVLLWRHWHHQDRTTPAAGDNRGQPVLQTRGGNPR